MAAWQNDVVPHSISSNPVMARAYSRAVWGYLHDFAAAVQAGNMALDPAQPIYIVEPGAGSGRLALTPHLDELTLPQLLSTLRLSAWDADVLRDCHAALLAQVQQADPIWYADVAAVLAQVWRQYLPLNEDDGLEKLIAHLFDVMGVTFSV